MLPDHVHECTECGNEEIYHVHGHEEPGDIALAYCPECGTDTDHKIGRVVA